MVNWHFKLVYDLQVPCCQLKLHLVFPRGMYMYIIYIANIKVGNLLFETEYIIAAFEKFGDKDQISKFFIG